MNRRDIFFRLNLESGLIELEVNLKEYELGTGWSHVGTVVGHHHFVSLSDSNQIVAFDTRTGLPVWIYQDNEGTFVPISYAHHRLVFGNKNGQIHCFRSA